MIVIMVTLIKFEMDKNETNKLEKGNVLWVCLNG